MLWICFYLPSCLFGNSKKTSVMQKKQNIFVLFINNSKKKKEIQIYSNKHETGLEVLKHIVHPKCLSFHNVSGA